MTSRLSPAEVAARTLTEAQWQRTVVGIAKAYGWRVYVPPIPGRRADNTVRDTAPGWPDLTLVRDHRLVFAELKRQTGRTTPAQDDWLVALNGVPGVNAFVWRPLDAEQVKQVLR